MDAAHELFIAFSRTTTRNSPKRPGPHRFNSAQPDRLPGIECAMAKQYPIMIQMHSIDIAPFMEAGVDAKFGSTSHRGVSAEQLLI
jgi:hypothetical protein